MDELLNKRGCRIFCTYINPLIIGVLLPEVIETAQKKIGLKFWVLFVLGVFLIVVYVYSSYKYDKMQRDKENDLIEKEDELRDKEKLIEKLNKEVNSFDKGMRELATLCYDSSTSLNKVSQRILSGDTTLDIWNFKKVCIGICNSVYTLLCQSCAPCDDFTVNIMLADPTATGRKRNITMIAHKGKYEKYPGKFEEKLYFDKYNTFYAVKVFKSNKTDIKILTSKEEVNEKFVYIDEEHPEYSQYVGIPIVCSGKKIICLLQICAFGNDKIAETKSDILKVITQYIFPFTHYALLTYKVEKSLVSSFSIIRQGEGDGNGEN